MSSRSANLSVDRPGSAIQWGTSVRPIASIGAGLLLAYLFSSPSHSIANSTVLAPIVGDRSSTLAVNTYFFGGAALVIAYLWSASQRSRNAILGAMWISCLLIFLSQQTFAHFSRHDLVPDDSIASLASIEIGLLVALVLPVEAISSLLIPAIIVSSITAFLYFGGGSVFVSGDSARAAGGSNDIVATSGTLAVLAPIPLVLAVRSSDLIHRWVCGGALALLLCVLCLTASWAGAAASAASLVCVGFTLKKRWLLIATLCAALLLFSEVVVFRTLSERGSYSNMASKLGRIQLIRSSLERTHAGWPSGDGMSPTPLTILNPVTHEFASSQDPHCEPLYACQQFGVGGLLMCAALVCLTVSQIRGSVKSAQPMLVGLTVSFGVLSLFESTLFVVARYPLMILFGLGFGYLTLAPPVMHSRRNQ